MLGCSVTLEAQSVNIVMDHSQNWMEPSETCFVSCIMTLAYCCVFVQLAVRDLCKYWHGPLYLWECYSLCFHGNAEWTHFHTNFSYFNPLAVISLVASLTSKLEPVPPAPTAPAAVTLQRKRCTHKPLRPLLSPSLPLMFSQTGSKFNRLLNRS